MLGLGYDAGVKNVNQHVLVNRLGKARSDLNNQLSYRMAGWISGTHLVVVFGTEYIDREVRILERDGVREAMREAFEKLIWNGSA